MSKERALTGACSCGRNRYIIEVPHDSADVAQVLFDNSHNQRKFRALYARVAFMGLLSATADNFCVGRSQATPISAWLRIPLSWYQSATYALFDDESHSSIRRVYTSPYEQHAKRHFCGFCGTPLSYWSESPPTEADYISLTLGSLSSGDLRDLGDLGLLPKEALDEAERDRESISSVVPHSGQNGADDEGSEGLPWFESMIEGSTLGKIKRSRGQRQSRGGNVRVEWEILEWTDEGDDDEDEELITAGKRKLAHVEDEDAAMEGVH